MENKKSKYIDYMIDIWNTSYDLSYKTDDKTGEEYALLTCPYKKWTSDTDATLAKRHYRITDKLILNCIEKEFFDKDRTQIAVADYGYIDIEAIADQNFKNLPEDIRQSIMDGTYHVI